jgi:hypothetical protein
VRGERAAAVPGGAARDALGVALMINADIARRAAAFRSAAGA